MIFLHLILAHLLGDFVFQSNDLIQKKYESWMGVFQHACIITLFTILALFPHWHQGEAWLVLGTIFLLHFIQDFLKIEFDIRYNSKKSTLPFFVDQILHITLIYLLSSWIVNLAPRGLSIWFETLYSSYFLAIYLIGVVIFYYTYDITHYQFLRKRSKKKLEYTANVPSMLKRVAAFSTIYWILVLASRLM